MSNSQRCSICRLTSINLKSPMSSTGTYRTTVGTTCISYMYVLWTVASAHKCEAPALWFDRLCVWTLGPASDQCVWCLGTFEMVRPLLKPSLKLYCEEVSWCCPSVFMKRGLRERVSRISSLWQQRRCRLSSPGEDWSTVGDMALLDDASDAAERVSAAAAGLPPEDSARAAGAIRVVVGKAASSQSSSGDGKALGVTCSKLLLHASNYLDCGMSLMQLKFQSTIRCSALVEPAPR